MNSIIRLDTRGRLVIPNEFRETLDLQEGDEVLLSLESRNNTIIISPVYGNQNDLIKIEIKFDDTPGALAKIANKLSEIKIDLVMTESKSFQRGKKARWNILADISKCPYSINEIKKKVLKPSFVESASITKIARGRLHR
ncbi:MAG: AbrB/MazE/SpoVT family DNA-binding domain-containing protein [Thermoplasmatales archaeon]|nr:AbrB/MazE/SpoVT family DNA-binding domain-containing protein [Thermoplasmatales archaeon]